MTTLNNGEEGFSPEELQERSDEVREALASDPDEEEVELGNIELALHMK